MCVITVMCGWCLADSEERRVAIIAQEVTKKQQECEADLVKAEPALIAAQVHVNILQLLVTYGGRANCGFILNF